MSCFQICIRTKGGQMNASSRQKGYWAVGGAFFVFALLAFPRVALALPCEEHYIVYYDDANYTNAVGGEGRDCLGLSPPYHWGTTSSHYAMQECCCDNPYCDPGQYQCNPGTTCTDGNCPTLALC